MADIFVSYKREDRNAAQKLASALQASGYSVWYDFELLSGDPFRSVIRGIIDQSSIAVVIWTERSVQSEFVLDEASYAKAKGKLLPVRIGPVELPFGFGQAHTEDLTEWYASGAPEGYERLIEAVRLSVGARTFPGDDVGARESELQDFRAAIMAKGHVQLAQFVDRYTSSNLLGVARAEIEARQKLSYRWKSLPWGARVAATLLMLGVIGGGTYGFVRLLVTTAIDAPVSAYTDPLSQSQLAALTRQALEKVSQGQCDDKLMQPPLHSVCLNHVGPMKMAIEPLGRIADVAFEGRHRSASGVGHASRFLVSFEKGRMRWEVNGSADGRLTSFWSTGRVDEKP